MKQINNESQLTEVVKEDGFVYVLKHSNTCPISQAAFDEYDKFSKEHPELSCYYLIVQEARPLSNYIAENYHIKHESPQAILFHNGDVNWHASHWKITQSSLNHAISENT